jgi:hypothetical protein
MKTRILPIMMLAVFLFSCAAERKEVKYNPFESVGEKQERSGEIKKPGYIHKVFRITSWHLRNINEVIRQVEKIMSPDGQLELNAERTAIIVYDSPEVMEGVMNLINEID